MALIVNYLVQFHHATFFFYIQLAALNKDLLYLYGMYVVANSSEYIAVDMHYINTIGNTMIDKKNWHSIVKVIRYQVHNKQCEKKKKGPFQLLLDYTKCPWWM